MKIKCYNIVAKGELAYHELHIQYIYCLACLDLNDTKLNLSYYFLRILSVKKTNVPSDSFKPRWSKMYMWIVNSKNGEYVRHYIFQQILTNGPGPLTLITQCTVMQNTSRQLFWMQPPVLTRFSFIWPSDLYIIFPDMTHNMGYSNMD